VDKQSVDVFISDPPYKDVDAYGKLAEVAAQLLKPGGSVFAMAGQYHLRKIMAAMDPHLMFHWQICYNLKGPTQPIHQKKVTSKWKPFLWYVAGGDYNGPVVVDQIQGGGVDKRFHEWGQDIEGIAHLIQMVTKPGQTVCDPFVGSGTTAVAALQANRKFVGCDIDEGCVKIALNRIEREVGTGNDQALPFTTKAAA